MRERLHTLFKDESGQAMTSSASFLACCALLGAGVWYVGGARMTGFLDMIMHAAPPGTSESLFR